MSPEACKLVLQWGIHPILAEHFLRIAAQVERETGRKLTIISGWRSANEQASLKTAGRPTADPDLSNHLTCPATAIDVRLGVSNQLLTSTQKQIFGRIVTESGLRWGGGSKPDSKGIPSDWNHIDMGPRVLVQRALQTKN